MFLYNAEFVSSTSEFTLDKPFDDVPVIEELNGFLYTNDRDIGTTPTIVSSNSYKVVKYDVSQLVGQSIHAYTKWKSNSASGDIGIFYFVNGNNNTIVEGKWYKDYQSEPNIAFTVDTDYVVPANATQAWIGSTISQLPKPSIKLSNPTIKTLTMSTDDITTDYMNTVCVEQNGELVAQPLSDVIESVSKKSINLLFVGNSLTQDGVSYLPMILKNIAPELDFNIWIWYDGGYTLSQILGKWNNGTAATIVSNSHNVINWTNWNNSKKIEDILSQAKFDIVILEEYFTYMTTYGQAELTVFENVVQYLQNKMDYSFKLAFLFHMVHLDQERESGDISQDERFSFMKTATQLIYDSEPISSIIPLGFASYRASKTDLNNLGDVGGLSPDYTHAQEGLPCQLLAWTTATWLFNQLGIVKGVINDGTRITTANYDSINVPGPNIGSGLVVGTEAQYKLSQKVAIQAVKECNDTFKFTIPTV